MDSECDMELFLLRWMSVELRRPPYQGEMANIMNLYVKVLEGYCCGESPPFAGLDDQIQDSGRLGLMLGIKR